LNIIGADWTVKVTNALIAAMEACPGGLKGDRSKKKEEVLGANREGRKRSPKLIQRKCAIDTGKCSA